MADHIDVASTCIAASRETTDRDEKILLVARARVALAAAQAVIYSLTLNIESVARECIRLGNASRPGGAAE